MVWRADSTTITADQTAPTADGFQNESEWFADTTNVTADQTGPTADGNLPGGFAAARRIRGGGYSREEWERVREADERRRERQREWERDLERVVARVLGEEVDEPEEELPLERPERRAVSRKVQAAFRREAPKPAVDWATIDRIEALVRDYEARMREEEEVAMALLLAA